MANKKTETQTAGVVSRTMSTEAVGNAEERLSKIATAAFLRAASRDFVGGDPVEDWLQAEIEIDTNGKSR